MLFFQKCLHLGIRIKSLALILIVKVNTRRYIWPDDSFEDNMNNTPSRVDLWRAIMEFNDSNLTNLSYANTQQEFILAASKRSLHKIGLVLGFYIYPVITPIGLIGNVLTLLVLVRNRGSGLSCRIYMALLAIFDSITLLNGIVGKEDVYHRMIN